MQPRPVLRIVYACLTGVFLAACAAAQVWVTEAGWPPFPGDEAQALLAEASRLADNSEGAQAAKKAAEFAYQRDLPLLALEGAELWHARDRRDREALALLAALRVAAGQTEPALDAARAGLSRSTPETPFLDSFTRRMAGINLETLNSGTLLPFASRLAEEFPESQAVLELAARVALEAGDFERAVQYAQAVLAQDPQADSAHLLLATALLRAGNLDSALAHLTEQLALRDSQVLDQGYAMLLLEGRQPQEALSRVRSLRRRQPDAPELALLEATMLRRVGGGNFAEPILLELFARDYQADRCREELGRIAAAREDWLEAMEWYAGIQSARLAPAAAWGLVEAFVAEEAWDDALAAVLDLVRRYPEHTYESLPLAAWALQRADRGADALAAYDQALRYHSESRQLRMARAHLLVELQRHRKAIRAMEALRKDYPRDSAVLNALGYTLADRGVRLKEAHEYIRLALDLAPGALEIIDSMGWVLYRLGRPEEALPFLEQAQGSFPHPEVAAHLCEVLFELGKSERAQQLLREALLQHEDDSLLLDVQKRYSR